MTTPRESFEYVRNVARCHESTSGLVLNKQQETTAPAIERKSSWGYRPAIDGLRSVAVVSVLLEVFVRYSLFSLLMRYSHDWGGTESFAVRRQYSSIATTSSIS